MTLPVRRFLTGFTLFVLIVGLALWWGSMLAISLNATRIASAIEDQLGPGFEVGSVSGDLFRGLMIEGCAAGPDPAKDPSGEPILQAATAQLLPDYLLLLQGEPAIREVRFSDVTLILRRQADGTILWPPFIQRAATAQGAQWSLTSFDWSLARAEIQYFPTLDSKAVRAQVPAANGSFNPGKSFRIDRCNGTLSDAPWELSGSMEQPSGILHGTWKLKEAGVWTLTQAFTSHRNSNLDSAAIPTGTVSGVLSVGGTIKDPQVTGKLDWRDGTLRFFKVDQGELQLDWRPGVLTCKESVIKAYQGRLKVSGQIDFRSQPATYKLLASTEQMELGQFLGDAGFDKLQLTGKYEADIEGLGRLDDVGSFKGQGKATARKGQTLNPLYDPQIPDSKPLMNFDSLTTLYSIADRMLILKETQLASPDVQIVGGGLVDLDGDLNLNAVLTAPGRMFVNHPQYGPAVRSFQLQNEPIGLLLRVGGTLERPELQVSVDPASISDAAKKGLFGRIKDLLSGGDKKADSTSDPAPGE